VNLVESKTYKVRQHVPDAYVRAAVALLLYRIAPVPHCSCTALLLYGAAFMIAADWVSP